MTKILITGSAGFIFSNFIIYALQNTKWDIVSIDKLTYAGSLLNVPQVKRHKLYLGDVCDYHFVKQVFEIEKPDIVIHGAAESHVDNSIENSHNFVTTNVTGTHSMLEAALKVHTPKKFINVSCYDENTKAVTKDGLKNYCDLSDGDVVFTINPKTGLLEEQPAEKVIVQDYNGDMISFNKPGVSMLVTPNHRMYDRGMNIREAAECANMDAFYFPKPNGWKSYNNSMIKVGKQKQNLKDLFYIAGAFLGDGFTAYQEKESVSKSGLNRKDFIKKARDPKTGRFFSTGKVGENDTVVSKSYRIFFDIPKNDKARKRTEETLNRLGVNFTEQSGKSGEHLYFTSKEWLEFFNQFGKYAKNKFIPRWMLEYDKDTLQCLFDGLIDTDGCRSPKLNISFSTVSDKLKDGICELAIKIGMIPNARYVYNESYLDGRKISGYVWQITFSGKRHKSVKSKHIVTKKYSGKVWCIRVKNRNFLVERNGTYLFSGNTDEVYGSVEEGSSLESDMLEPRSPYSSTKAAADLLGRSYFVTHGLPVITTRCSNNFGPRQHVEKFIPKAITNILTKQKIPLYGDGKNMREWIYVKDHFEALVAVVEKGTPGEVYNISSGYEKQNIEVLQAMFNIMGGEELLEYVEDRAGHDRRYSVDCSKLRALGWKPVYPFESALVHTIGWYKANTWFWR